MKIGFDVSQTGSNRTGCGNLAYNLLRALADQPARHNFILYPTFGDGFFDPDWPRSTYLPKKPNFARGGPRHREQYALQEFWSDPPGDLEARFGDPDIVHSNNFYCPPGLASARLIYTLYDLSFLENPEWHVDENRATCFEGVFQASLQADRIIAISHFSKRSFLQVFPHYPEDRIIVVHLASRFQNANPLPQPKNLARLQPHRFWLCVGTLEPRKNHARLLSAYAQAKAKGGPLAPLVLAGGKGWRTENLKRLIWDLGLGDDVFMTGYLNDDAVQWLYQNCYAALYPSLYEGFGLPVLEAMSQGAAVIASDATSIPEIATGAALLIDPYNEEDIAAAILRLAGDGQLRRQLQEQARQRAEQFRWEAAAHKTIECYQEALLSPKFSDSTAETRDQEAGSLYSATAMSKR